MKTKEILELLSSDVAGINETLLADREQQHAWNGEVHSLLTRIAIGMEALNTRDQLWKESSVVNIANAVADIKDDETTRAPAWASEPQEMGNHEPRNQANVWCDDSTGFVWVKKTDYDELRGELELARKSWAEAVEVVEQRDELLKKISYALTANDTDKSLLSGVDIVSRINGLVFSYHNTASYTPEDGPAPTGYLPTDQDEVANEQALQEVDDYEASKAEPVDLPGFHEGIAVSYPPFPRKIKDNPQA